MNIGVLCNSKLCLPSVHRLVQMGHKVNFGMPKAVSEDHPEMEQFAFQFGIPVTKLDKETLDKDLIFWKEQNGFDFIFVITFPYILSADLIANIKLDMINFHFAPLPQYKGGQPAFWLLKNGEKTGGTSVHILTEKIDGGDLLHLEPYTLTDKETYKSYLTNVALLNADVIQKITNDIAQPFWKNKLKKQKSSKAVYYPKPQLEDIRIHWDKMDAVAIERLCRACNPWNKGAIAVFNLQAIKLIEVTVLAIAANQEPAGTVVRITNPERFVVSCRDNKYLEINIAYQEDLGFFSNHRLAQLGLKAGLVLQ